MFLYINNENCCSYCNGISKEIAKAFAAKFIGDAKEKTLWDAKTKTLWNAKT